jgi:hypothetical protein
MPTDAFANGPYRGRMFSAFFRRIDPETLSLASTVAFTLAAGVLIGLVCALAVREVPIAVRSGCGATVVAVTFDGFRDGLLRGRSAGPVRLFAGEEPVEVAPDGSFAFDHPGFHIEEVTVPVPAGMRFVASRKGKKYYSVTSAAGERIAPANRVYFPDEAAARAAGFSI